MIRASIGTKLTAWYVAVLAVATLFLAAASWWLSTKSVVRAADIGLQARVDGVQKFLENPQTRLTVEGLRDEFGEYAELTRDEALLEVLNAAGTVLVRPSIPGWTEMAQRETPTASRDVRPTDRVVDGEPYRVASAHLEALGRSYRVIVAAPMGPAYGALNRFHQWLFLLWPAVLALAGAGGYWISRRALAPVDQVTRAVQAITVQNLGQRLPVPAADDELRRLAITFNDVLARLEFAVGDIVRFTADASHELRTPVALVRTTAELALRHQRTSHDYRRALADVVEHARTMTGLVDDLLILARTDAGIEPRDTGRIDVRHVVAEATQEIHEFARTRSVKMLEDFPAQPLVIRGDRVAFRRLLLILLDNAVKYSLPGGTVNLRVTAETADGESDRQAVIAISDDGIGLDVSDSTRLFERFFRGSRARQHAPEGTGLGLAIARTIVDRHGGSIELSPARADGHGCVVVVRMSADVIRTAESPSIALESHPIARQSTG